MHYLDLLILTIFISIIIEKIIFSVFGLVANDTFYFLCAVTKMSLASIMQSKLKKEYQLEIEWKEASLIPMIENRKAYLSWIHDLLKMNKDIISEIGGSFEAGKLLDMYFLIRSNIFLTIYFCF